MAQLRVNPTRMELLRLKKRAALAKKGHKLLKEKRDGLMQEFLKIVRKAHELRREADSGLSEALGHFVMARASVPAQAVRMISELRTQQIELSVSEKNVMGVRLPDFRISTSETGENYSSWETSPELDAGMKSFRLILPKLLELAEVEKSAQLLAQEIEKTRRRVNALEYVLIPQLSSTIRYIRMKLDEQERAAIVTTMAVKENL